MPDVLLRSGMLSVNSLSKDFPGRTVLQEVSFSLKEKETLAVLGPSGCGKTTLLYLLCGLIAPDRGKVLLDGRPVRGTNQDIAIILQDYGLLPWKTVLSNVALGLKLQSVPAGERRRRSLDMLKELGLEGREQDYPNCLSGGERQRVAIARAYAMKPKLLLMDEPFSSLDAITREQLQNTLVQSWQTRKLPYVLVTHSVEEAVFLGRRIMVLGGSPASPKAVYENPEFGTSRVRHSNGYFELVRTVRHDMEALW